MPQIKLDEYQVREQPMHGVDDRLVRLRDATAISEPPEGVRLPRPGACYIGAAGKS